MMLCNSEIMKSLKLLEQKKRDLVLSEQRNHQIKYVSEEDKMKSDYSFSKTRTEIQKIDARTRELKQALAKANVEVIVPEFGMSIGECLVYMAQLNQEKERLDTLSQKEKLSRQVGFNGVVEYTELAYDPDLCKSMLDSRTKEILKLQVAIDRVNITNMIEVSDFQM